MSKLLKYEFRRSRTIFLGIAGIAVIINAIFLIGYALDIDSLFSIGLISGILCIGFGSTAVLIFSVINFNEDISKRQGYLLFSIPRSNKQIIGAKLITTLIAFAGLTILFAILISIDLAYSIYQNGSHYVGVLQVMFWDTTLTGEELYKTLFTASHFLGVCLIILDYIFSFLCKVVLAYLAIVLTKTLLGNRKGRIFLALVIWCAATFGLSLLGNVLTAFFLVDYNTTNYSAIDSIASITDYFCQSALYLPTILVNIVACIGGFFLTDWLTNKKLSL